MNRSLHLGIALLLAAALLAGCWETRVTYDGWAHFRQQFGDPPSQPNDRRGGPGAFQVSDPTSGWTIRLDSFEGPARYRRAADLMRSLAGKLEGIWMHQDSEKVNVFRGRFENVTDLDAQSALLETRALTIDGVKPYEGVQLVSLGVDGQPRATTPLDLRQFSNQGLYTLQIGFYDDAYGTDFRDAAETAARELRDEGTQAFYYHGANRSMVTVELFSDADFEQDGPVRVYGPRMLQLQERFKYNLANGRTIVQKFNEGKKQQEVTQPSFIVKVP